MRFLTVILCLLSVAFAAPTLATDMVDTQLDPKPTTLDIKEIDRRAKLLMKQREMTGMSIAIVEHGRITFTQGYGERLRGSGLKVTPDTVFRWASVSKSVGAHTLLSLAEDGEVSLNDPLTAYPTSLELPPHENPAKLGHLLSHQIGVVRNAYDGKIEEGRSAKQTRSKLKELAILCPPGTCHTYQNVAYDTMTEVIEAKTGLPYKTVVKQRLFDPLGMDSASLTLEGLTGAKNWASPHNRYGRAIDKVKPTYYRVPAAAGVNSSVKDLAKWMIAQMPATGILPEERLAAMQQPIVETYREQKFINYRFGGLKQAHYGMGWRVYDYNGHKVVGHRGGVQGYRALVMFDPEREAGIAMLWNSPHSRPIGMQFEFLDQLYGMQRKDWLRLNEKPKSAALR